MKLQGWSPERTLDDFFDDIAVHNDDACNIELYRQSSTTDGAELVGVGCETCNEIILEVRPA